MCSRWWARGVAASLVLLGACAARQAPAPSEVVYSGTLQELMPHHAGDEFTYRAKDEFSERLQVETLTALDQPGELMDVIAEDGAPIGKTHLRDTGTAVLILSEYYLRDDMLLTYDPPLPMLVTPLRRTALPVIAAVTVTRLSDGQVVDHGPVEQTTSVEPVVPDERGIRFGIHIERTTTLVNRVWRFHVTTFVAPGVGEIWSEGRANDGPAFRRDLLCATIGGRRVGQCPPPEGQP